MTDDSPSSPDAGDGTATPIEPDRTVVRPSEPQPEPPAHAIDDGDTDPTEPIRAQAPPPPPPPSAEAPTEAVTEPQGGAATTVVATVPQTAFFGGDDGNPPASAVAAGEPDLPLRATRAGITAAVVAIGTGLLGAAVLVSAFRARSDGDLDWSNFGVGLGATAVLLVIAVLGSLAARTPGGRAREEVVTWPGVVGILATAVMIGIGIDQEDNWVAYLIGGTIFVLSVIGYVAARRAAFVVLAILGLALVYGVAFDDLVADSVGDGHGAVTGAVLIALFVVVVTLVGWALPSRAVSGVAVGAFGLVGFVGILVTFIATRYFFGMFGFFASTDDEFGMGGDDPFAQAGFPEGDVWWVLALAGLLVVLWALAAAITNHSGFTILAIAGPAILVPLASVALAAEHPTWWAAIPAAAGGVLLLGAWGLARLRGRRTASELPV